MDIIQPLGRHAKKRSDDFANEYAKVLNRFTLEFAKEYCAPDGAIMWERLVRYNSGKRKS